MKPDGRFEEIFRCGGDSQGTNRILQIIAAVFPAWPAGLRSPTPMAPPSGMPVPGIPCRPSALAVEIAGSGIMLDLLCLRTGLFPLGMQIIHPCFDRE